MVKALALFLFLFVICIYEHCAHLPIIKSFSIVNGFVLNHGSPHFFAIIPSSNVALLLFRWFFCRWCFFQYKFDMSLFVMHDTPATTSVRLDALNISALANPSLWYDEVFKTFLLLGIFPSKCEIVQNFAGYTLMREFHLFNGLVYVEVSQLTCDLVQFLRACFEIGRSPVILKAVMFSLT